MTTNVFSMAFRAEAYATAGPIGIPLKSEGEMGSDSGFITRGHLWVCRMEVSPSGGQEGAVLVEGHCSLSVVPQGCFFGHYNYICNKTQCDESVSYDM